MDWIQTILSILALITLLVYHKETQREIRYLKSNLDIEREFSRRIKNILKRHFDKLLEAEKEND